MRNRRPIALAWLIIVGLLPSLSADEPPKKLTPAERKQLEAEWVKHDADGIKAFRERRFVEAERIYEASLDVARRLFPKAAFPDGHVNLALSLHNLGLAREERGRFAEAEDLARDSLEMYKRLLKGDHSSVVNGYRALAQTLRLRGKLAEAETACRDALAMSRRLSPQKEHVDVASALHGLGVVLQQEGKLAEAETTFRETLAMWRRLYPNQDHVAVASAMNNLAFVLHARGQLADAEPLYRDAFDMSKRLFKGDHPELANRLENLGFLLRARGKYTEAETNFRQSLTMWKNIFPNQDHPSIAVVLNHLGFVLRVQGKFDEAEKHFREALEMRQRLFPKQDHLAIASSLNNLGVTLRAQQKLADAEKAGREAVEMYRRLFKGDHPDLATGLNNLALVLDARGKPIDAEALHRDALAMRKRLFANLDHPDVVKSLTNLANVLAAQGKHEEADRHYREALRMHLALIESYAARAAEGDALTLLASFPYTIAHYLRNARALKSDPATVYADIWNIKGAITHAVERRHLIARAAATDPKAANILTELTEARRSRSEFILAPTLADPATMQARVDAIQKLTDRITDLDRGIRVLLPSITAVEQLARATPADLQKQLAADAVFVDFFADTLFEQDKERPGTEAAKLTPSYVAFVVTKTSVKWIDLGPAAPIENAVRVWRESITTPPFVIPADIPVKVRELLWATVRKEFPQGTRVVYLSPDLALTRVPWVALPGDMAGKLVLEEFAIAVIPNSQFLLDQLKPRDPRTTSTGGLLAVGGVPYDTATPLGLWSRARMSNLTRGELPLKAGAKLEWPELKHTKGEAEMAARLAERKKLERLVLAGSVASSDRVLSELPGVRFAHFATHGFFADASFRSALQVDPRLFEMTRLGERVGAGALSPMTMSGLVFAGANRPETRGRGLVTGDHLIDRDLSGLELAVLSACETGLGDVAGGEGVFGLQRAFHIAGCRNVVASLWKVDDAATAALMNEFYTQLWVHDQPPVIALQKAQLAIYRADPKEFSKIASRGIEEGTIDLSNVPVKKYPANPTKGNHPALWAAFTLSGAGR